MCQRENEVVDVLKSIQELKVRDEKVVSVCLFLILLSSLANYDPG